MQRSDDEILHDVQAELKWEPSLRSEHIAIAVRDGVVSLAGYVLSYYDKWKAERVAGHVKGVRALANDIEVRLPSSSIRPDPEIARAIIEAFRWNLLIPHDDIRVTVDHGWVTLEGHVNWYYQKEEAERAVRGVTGVRGVTNLCTVIPAPASSDVKQRIKDALARGVRFDAEHIQVEITNSRAILKGTVRSYTERHDAERAALNAPGVTQVENHLVVDPTVGVSAAV